MIFQVGVKSSLYFICSPNAARIRHSKRSEESCRLRAFVILNEVKNPTDKANLSSRNPICHSERSEESKRNSAEILPFAHAPLRMTKWETKFLYVILNAVKNLKKETKILHPSLRMTQAL